MGKPYESELRQFTQTYQWALGTQIAEICSFIDTVRDLPLVTVGSGGSVTAAHMATLLHQEKGPPSKAVTPLELATLGQSIRDAGVLILSAGGSNADILSAFRFAALSEPRQVMALCMKRQSPLAQLSAQFRYTRCLGFDLPVGKDGFLATNSLLAFITVLVRAYCSSASHKDQGVLSYTSLSMEETLAEFERAGQPLLSRDTWIVLYGGWGLPAAVDIESKFTEAALGHIQIADYRNFGHGRHHWLAKRGGQTGVLSLVTPGQRDLAERTLELLPKNIPTLRVETDQVGPTGGLDLLIKVMHLVHLVGIARGIDPGKPGVPQFGSRLYRLRATFNGGRSVRGLPHQQATAIVRKARIPLNQMQEEEFEEWKKAYRAYNQRLSAISFGTVVFDYDGTLCDPWARYEGAPCEIIAELERLLQAGIVIGVATGRGKSVRNDLQRLISNKWWNQVLIGYYNGSDIALLSDRERPCIQQPFHPMIEELAQLLNSDSQFTKIARPEPRPCQITVETSVPALWRRIRSTVLDHTAKANLPGLRVLESSHSLDIVAPGVSKLHLMTACAEIAKQRCKPDTVLCVGDKGEWPGNDYDLLSTEFSLSVDTVSPDPASCWHLGPAGHRGVQAMLGYLNCMEAADGILSLNLKKRQVRNA